MTSVEAPSLRPIEWRGDNVALLDQTRLPSEEVWLDLADYRAVIVAIKEMRIRGAPAIGVAGAYAVALAAIEFATEAHGGFEKRLRDSAEEVRTARPTGANLAWAVDRMLNALDQGPPEQDPVQRLVAEATAIQAEDEAANRRIGELGADLIPSGSSVMTHCNAGALATGGYGTALGIVYSAWAKGALDRVYATETRPFLQGARLTAWELTRAGIDVTLIADSAAGHLMRKGSVQAILVGADCIAANGDVANKIGTYSLAVLASENGVPFYVAAPTSTVDLTLSSGDEIPIEERPSDELTHILGERVTPQEVAGLNIAFDVTPSRYVTAIVTENSVIRGPFETGLAESLEASRA